MLYNMQASLILDDRYPQGDHAFVAVRVFRVPAKVSGKGDHFHRGETEAPYAFTSLEQLLADFWTAVDDWRM